MPPALAVNGYGCFLPDLTRFTTLQCGEARQFFQAIQQPAAQYQDDITRPLKILNASCPGDTLLRLLNHLYLIIILSNESAGKIQPCLMWYEPEQELYFQRGMKLKQGIGNFSLAFLVMPTEFIAQS